MELDMLKKPFPPEDIRWRISRAGYVGKTKKIWCRCLAYVTSRATQERLDEICGMANWRNEYKEGPGGGVLCGLSLRIGGEWITKWDGADNTKFEAVKGGLSGAQKRAGYQWGIGRYLYNLEEDFGLVSDNGSHSGSFKVDGKEIYFKFDPPDLPKWALPENYKPDKNKETFEEFKAELEKTTSPETLNSWGETNKEAIGELLNGPWRAKLKEIYNNHLEFLKKIKEKEIAEARDDD
jgi:hypothetical protein